MQVGMMTGRAETRSDFFTRKLSEFESSGELTMAMNLYSKEIKKIAKQYPNFIVEKGERVKPNSSEDKRYKCIISKFQ